MIYPSQPGRLAEAVVEALAKPSLRKQAAEVNTRLVREWASYADGMRRAVAFYGEIVGRADRARAGGRSG